jgi:hypothetical protein
VVGTISVEAILHAERYDTRALAVCRSRVLTRSSSTVGLDEKSRASKLTTEASGSLGAGAGAGTCCRVGRDSCRVCTASICRLRERRRSSAHDRDNKSRGVCARRTRLSK